MNATISSGSVTLVPSPRRGHFLSFEGIDGAGKSSHIAGVADWFRARGATVTVTREPGGTPLAEVLRTQLLTEDMDPLTEALLMFAARRDHVCRVIEPALQRGEVVISDRFTDASFAYQGGGRGFDVSVLCQLEAWVQAVPEGGVCRPDLTLWFDLPPETAAERLASARTPDKFEREPVAFFTRVAAGYAARATADPQRFVRIDAARSMEAVWAQVVMELAQRADAWAAP
jgi:dTMP kinase